MDESSPITTSDHPLFIGGDQTQGQFFHGRIDEVRVFNGARTAAEVLSDMNTPVGSKVESLLRRHYSLESKLKRRRSTGVRAEIY